MGTGESPMDERCRERLDRFRDDIRAGHDPPMMVRKYILQGGSFLLNDDDHFAIRNEVATNFSLHPNEVFLVGSSKLGFSIAPSKRYKPFGDTSDIDLALVSDRL